MENLNDLIWTDEDNNENDGISTQGSEMHQACMIAFCGGGGSNPPVDPLMSGFACGRAKYSHTGPCH